MENQFYKTPETVDLYIKMAEGHSGAELIKKLNSFLQPGASLVELGTGPGTDWEILNERYKVTGSDFSNEFLFRLKKRFPEGEFMELNAATLETDRKFDVVYSNKVLHHLTDEELAGSIARQAELLNPEGVVCHSFWKGEGTEVYEGMFVNNHETEELRDLFGGQFEILVMELYKEFEEEDSILLIAKKK